MTSVPREFIGIKWDGLRSGGHKPHFGRGDGGRGRAAPEMRAAVFGATAAKRRVKG
jgi:hypothetical protein